MRQRLNHVVCLSLMREAEVTNGINYTFYARTRLDSMFFAPLPASVLESARVPWTAVVPAGDAWGGDPDNLGVCDRMLFGRRKAFTADVYGWKAFRRNSSHLSGRNLVGETYQRAILEHAKVFIVRVKMAYATLSVYGKGGKPGMRNTCQTHWMSTAQGCSVITRRSAPATRRQLRARAICHSDALTKS